MQKTTINSWISWILKVWTNDPAIFEGPYIYWTQYQEPEITLRMARNDDTLWYFKSPRWKIAHLVWWFMPRMYLLPTRLITEHGTLTAGLKKQGVTRQRRYENWHDGHPETHQDRNWSFGHNLGVGVLEDNKTTQPRADHWTIQLQIPMCRENSTSSFPTLYYGLVAQHFKPPIGNPQRISTVPKLIPAHIIQSLAQIHPTRYRWRRDWPHCRIHLCHPDDSKIAAKVLWTILW